MAEAGVNDSPSGESAVEPRAVVGGVSYTEWPQDLYIPPEALEVFLERFEGPLDLLLYLIRKANIDILDIPIADVTRQYMEYVEMMRLMRLDLAGEYLVMAATLAEIKSRMLLPKPELADEEGEDPRAALVRQLQEYERFRKAAFDLADRPHVGRDIYLAFANYEYIEPVERLPSVELADLVAAFQNVIVLAGRNKHLVVGRETLSVRERMTMILERLQSHQFTRFEDLFTKSEGRMGVVVTFVAILELVKDGILVAVQNEPFAPIHISTTV